MRRLSEGEKIGAGRYKEVYSSKEDPEAVIANFREPIGNDEVKSAFYLGKIAHILFPDNIPDIHAAFNDESQNSKLYLENAHTDEEHKQHTQYYMNEAYDAEKSRLGIKYHDKNLEDLEFNELWENMANKGLKPDMNPFNFARSPNGKPLYLDNEAGYVRKPHIHARSFNSILLKRAVEELPEGAQKQLALNYYDRLIELTRKE